MEFLNPMFVIAESFARRYGLHDRRPKTSAQAPTRAGPSSPAPTPKISARYKAEGETVELDMGKIAQMATDLIGELVR